MVPTDSTPRARRGRLEQASRSKASPSNLEPHSWSGAFRDIADGTFSLFSNRLALARHELMQDLKEAGGSAGAALAGGAVVLFGYILLNLGVILLTGALWKGALGMGVSALLLAALNLGGGLAVLARSAGQLKTNKGALEQTREALEKDKAWLKEIRNKPELAPPEP